MFLQVQSAVVDQLRLLRSLRLHIRRFLSSSGITTTTVYLRTMGIDAMSEAHQRFSLLVAAQRSRASV